MGRLVHARGDLQMNVNGIDICKEQLQILGQMGVWDAQILLEPEEVATLAKSMFKPRIIGYVITLPFTLRRRARSRTSEEAKR